MVQSCPCCSYGVQAGVAGSLGLVQHASALTSEGGPSLDRMKDWLLRAMASAMSSVSHHSASVTDHWLSVVALASLGRGCSGKQV